MARQPTAHTEEGERSITGEVEPVNPLMASAIDASSIVAGRSAKASQYIGISKMLMEVREKRGERVYFPETVVRKIANNTTTKSLAYSINKTLDEMKKPYRVGLVTNKADGMKYLWIDTTTVTA